MERRTLLSTFAASAAIGSTAEAAALPKQLAYADLPRADRELIGQALAASAAAYAPYSKFAVGAAARDESDAVHVGANLENASYGMTLCAEVAALTSANTAGHRKITTLAVIGHKFSAPLSVGEVVTPCGRCRQLIAEIAQSSRIEVRVLSCSGDLTKIEESMASALLPDAFGPASIGMDTEWPKLQASLQDSVKLLRTKTGG